MARILILGAGFAGLWAAIGAARKLNELHEAAEIHHFPTRFRLVDQRWRNEIRGSRDDYLVKGGVL